MNVKADVELAVVGAGAAGMIAALYAASRGVECVLVERSTRIGTNAELSGGLLQAAGTRYQQELGIEDSAALMMADIMKKNRGLADPSVVLAICEWSKHFVHFIADYVGLELHLDRAVRWAGHSAFRMHTNVDENGHTLVRALRRAVSSNSSVTFVDNSPVIGLSESAGRVTGITRQFGSRVETISAEAVILANAGFAANEAMLGEFCPNALDAMFIGSANSLGDGIRWGMELGAATDHMGAWQGHAHVNPRYGTHLSGALPYAGAVIVNLDGRRFFREDVGYSEFSVEILRQENGRAIEIFDDEIMRRLSTNGILQEAVRAGAVRRCETLSEIAEQFRLPLEVLRSEISAYNDCARASSPDHLGRDTFGLPLTAPFYASEITGGIAHTQGGLRIDSRCRVLLTDGHSIEGLYAAGGVAAGMSGDGVDGYTSGNGLAHALSTGMIAADEIATSLGRPQSELVGWK